MGAASIGQYTFTSLFRVIEGIRSGYAGRISFYRAVINRYRALYHVRRS